MTGTGGSVSWAGKDERWFSQGEETGRSNSLARAIRSLRESKRETAGRWRGAVGDSERGEERDEEDALKTELAE